MSKNQEKIIMENGRFDLSKELKKVNIKDEQQIEPVGMHQVLLEGQVFYIMEYVDTSSSKEKNYALLTNINGELVNVLVDDYDLLDEYAKKKSYKKVADFTFPSHISSTQITCFKELLNKFKFRNYTHNIFVPTIEDMDELLLNSSFTKVKNNNKELLCKDAMYKELEKKLLLLKEKITINIKTGATGYVRAYDDEGYIRNKQVYLMPGKHVYIPLYIDCESMCDFEESERARIILSKNTVIAPTGNQAYCYNYNGTLIEPKLTRFKK